MQLICCKDTTKSLLPEIFVFTIFTVNITFINDSRTLYAQPYGSTVPSPMPHKTKKVVSEFRYNPA